MKLEVLSHLKKVGVTLILLILDKLTLTHRLQRVPEPEISDQDSQVDDYDRVMSSSMSAIYAFCLGTIHKLTAGHGQALKVADICCGPGQFTKLLSQHINCQELYGVDLSEPMLEKLKANVPQAKAIKDDMTLLKNFAEDGLDLVVAMNCLHHLPDKESVQKALAEFDRVTQPDGVVFSFDVARLKTAWQTRVFTDTFGMKGQKGFEFFHRDFELSMAAAWSVDELVDARPQSGKRRWYSLVPFGVPSLVGLIGLPQGYTLDSLAQSPLPPLPLEELIPPKYRTELTLLQFLMPLRRLKARDRRS